MKKVIIRSEIRSVRVHDSLDIYDIEIITDRFTLRIDREDYEALGCPGLFDLLTIEVSKE